MKKNYRRGEGNKGFIAEVFRQELALSSESRVQADEFKQYQKKCKREWQKGEREINESISLSYTFTK